MQRNLKLDIGGRTYDLELSGKDGEIDLAGTVDGEAISAVSLQVTNVDHIFTITKDGRAYPCAVIRQSDGVWASFRGRSYFARFPGPGSGAVSRTSSDEVRAPMTGTLLEVQVAAGDHVDKGQVLATMEAMKMEYRLEAESAGTVARVECTVGDRVDVGTLLIKLDFDSA